MEHIPEAMAKKFIQKAFYEFARFWKKNLLLLIIATIFSTILAFTVDPNLENFTPMDFTLAVLVIGLAIGAYSYYMKMFKRIIIAHTLSQSVALRLARILFGSFLFISLIRLITIDVLVNTILHLIEFVMFLTMILSLRRYFRDYADHLQDPNQSQPVDRAISLYLVIVIFSLFFLILGAFFSESIFLFVIAIGLSGVEFGVKFYIAHSIQKLFPNPHLPTSRNPLGSPFMQNVGEEMIPPTSDSSGLPYSPASFQSEVTNQDSSNGDVDTASFSYDKWVKSASTDDSTGSLDRCPECGAKLPPGSKMCGMCGAIFDKNRNSE